MLSDFVIKFVPLPSILLIGTHTNWFKSLSCITIPLSTVVASAVTENPAGMTTLLWNAS